MGIGEYLKSLTLNGNLFYGLIQEYATNIFSGEGIYFESRLTNVVFNNLREITETINENLKEKLDIKIKMFMILYNKLKIHMKYFQMDY